MRRFLLPVALLSLLGHCVSSIASAPSEADEAIAAVVSKIIERSSFESADVIPVCLGESFAASPSAAALRLLAKTDSRLTSCQRMDKQVTYVMIRQVAPVKPGHFLIGGGYYCGGLCADHHVYTVKKQGGKWIIVEDKFIWIS